MPRLWYQDVQDRLCLTAHAVRGCRVPTCTRALGLFLPSLHVVTYNTGTHKICRGGDLPLTCPTCRKSETRVVDSRDDETVVRRRRECLDPRCKHRFTTYERMEVPRLFVVKKDGRREQYSREKILTGLRKACEKRPISEGRMEGVAADLERELFARGESEVPVGSRRGKAHGGAA